MDRGVGEQVAQLSAAAAAQLCCCCWAGAKGECGSELRQSGVWLQRVAGGGAVPHAARARASIGRQVVAAQTRPGCRSGSKLTVRGDVGRRLLLLPLGATLCPALNEHVVSTVCLSPPLCLVASSWVAGQRGKGRIGVACCVQRNRSQLLACGALARSFGEACPGPMPWPAAVLLPLPLPPPLLSPTHTHTHTHSPTQIISTNHTAAAFAAPDGVGPPDAD